MTEFDDFHYHEMLDRTYTTYESIETVLLKHPLMVEIPTKELHQVRVLIQDAADKLQAAYQLIGNINNGKPTKQSDARSAEHFVLDGT